MGEAETCRPVSGPVELPFNVSRIRWRRAEGLKGPFELSDDTGNPDHKALLKFLVELAGGAVNSEGFFYWVFPDGRVIGRKPCSWKARRAPGEQGEG
jgi:hypothetical protein